MRQYFNLIGDRMPDKNQLHLPSFDRRNVYYDRYVGDMKAQAPEDDSIILGDSMFYKIWKRHFKEVVIPKVILHCIYS